jgi:fructokinase
VGIGEVLWDLLPSGRKLGGAPANFAYHAHALGAEGIPVSCIGTDPLGADILSSLGDLGLNPGFVTRTAAHATGTVSVSLDARGIPTFTIHEDRAWDHIPWSRQMQTLAQRSASVCFGTLGQRSPDSRQTVRRFLDATPASCLRVFDINLRQAFFDADTIRESLARASVLKLNHEELPVVARLLGLCGDEEVLLQELLAGYGLELIALTRGEHGSVLRTPEVRVEHPGFEVRVVDTVGAGDAFTAALVLGLLHGHELQTVSVAANRVGAYVATQHGATPPLPAELCARLWEPASGAT